MKGHIFQFINSSGRQVLNFRWANTPTHFGAVITEDRRHICHVPATGNDYALAEAPADYPDYKIWTSPGPDGKDIRVLLTSVHGSGEVRWAIGPEDIRRYLVEGDYGGIRKEDLEAVIEFFGLSK